MRGFMFFLHKYTGLLFGALISLIGVTGSILVFDHWLDETLNPHTVTAPDPAPDASLESVLAAARAAVPDDIEPRRIYITRKPGSPHIVRFTARPGAVGSTEVSINPETAEVLDVRLWGEYTSSWIYRLHFRLLAGDTGKFIVGISGLLLLVFCISGLVIWWPRNGRWRGAFTIRRGAGPVRLNFDLHKVVGLYLTPVIAVVAFSGVALVFSGPMNSAVTTVLPTDPLPSYRSTPDGDEPISVDEAVRLGRAAMPEADMKRVFLPLSDTDPYWLAMNQPGEPWSAHAASTVWIDQYSGEVLGTWSAPQAAAGNRFLAWQFPLHNGDALGMVGRWLVFLSGLAPALLFGTGVYVWWKKRRKKTRSLFALKKGNSPAF